MEDIRPLPPTTPVSTPPKNQLPPHHVPTGLKVVLLVFAIALIAALGYMVWFQNNLPGDDGGDTLIKPKTTTAATAPQKSDPLINLTYTNATYGFSLTFDDKWTGYKVKTVVPTDGSATAYLYANLPTTSTDAGFTADGPTNFAGSASLMSIGVYTPAQWAALAGTPSQGTKLAENAYYVFSYSPAQDYPTDLKAAYDDIASIIATFKLN